MMSDDNRMPVSTALVISAAFAVVFLVLFMWVGGFGFWGAFFLGLLIGVVVFIVLMLMFVGSGAVGAGPAAGASGAQTGAAIARDAAPEAKRASAAPVAAAAAPEAKVDTGAKPAPAKPAEAAPAKAAPAKPAEATPAKAAPAKAAPAKAKPAKPTPAKPTKAKAAKTAPAPETTEAPADAGTRPAALSAPRDGKADNLKEIKGVGPKMETMLNDMGFYHFDQIAGWSAAEVAWVDQNLKGFKGRVSRDGWVEQAKILASGGETEFSKRVDKGGVY